LTEVFKLDQYLRPETLEGAIQILQKYGNAAKIVAGGTQVYEVAKRGMMPNVKVLVDIERLGLSFIRPQEGGVTVGAGTTITQILESQVFRRAPYTVVREACNNIRPTQIRNMATVGGEICSGLSFLDLPTCLLALDASLTLVGPNGPREVALDGFYLDYFLTALKPTEILTETLIPNPFDRTGGAFLKLERTSIDLALINIAVVLSLNGKGECQKARIALGGGRTPIRIKRAEKALEGKKIESHSAESISQLVMDDFKPVGGVHASAAYKKKMSRVLAKEAITKANIKAQSG